MNFISHKQLLKDVRNWSNRLPDDLIAVVGVPRSGLLPALHLALHRNLHLVSLADLQAGRRPWEEPLRRFVFSKSEGRILIVDDSINTGQTLRSLRQKLTPSDGYLFGAVYGERSHASEVDFIYRTLPQPRCFEWMLFHSSQIENACLDLDGVLCEDVRYQEEDSGSGLDAWLGHLAGASSRFLPGRKVLAVVTSRLEKYRPQTEEWLRKHNVQYGELVMSPHHTAVVRRAARDHAARKAEYYQQNLDARLFIESSLEQSREIAELTGKPVLCTETMEVV